MIKLYGPASSPNVLKVLMLLEEAELDYILVPVRRDLGENRTPEFLQLSATGTLPAMVDDETDARVFESDAILLYLADKSGKFLPTEAAARAAVFKWLIYGSANIGPAFENIYQLVYLDEPWVDGASGFQKDKLKKHLGVLDVQLADHEYLAGQCSIADFALFPTINMIEDLLEIPASTFPNIARWSETLSARAGVKRALKSVK